MPGNEMTAAPREITREYLAGVRRRRHAVKAALSTLAHRDRRLAETLLEVCDDLTALGEHVEQQLRFFGTDRVAVTDAADQVRAADAEALAAEHGWGQPAPEPNDGASMHDLVIADMASRKEFGLAKYQSLLQAHNGRDALQDAYEESLDLVVYLRQEIEERRHARCR